MERLILDSGALITLERGQAASTDVLPEDANVAISAVTAAELLVGVELAGEPNREHRATMVDGVIERVEIIAFDLDITRHHASLLAHTRRSGRPRGAHDLQIAATARATNRVVITTDATAFNDLPGINYRLLS
ncbi:MAG: PIN domain-containing protein [Solirubrobacteraceae bacterium]